MVGQIGIAYIFAMMLNTRISKLKGIHRTLCYFPVTLSAVVIGFIWSMIYDFRFGMLNGLLRAIGQGDLQQAWLSNIDWVLTFASIPIVWQFIGLYMVIFLAAFTAIDQNVMDMAEIDGATGIQRMIFIAMPLLKNTFVVALILCISGNMKTFDHIFVMTGGGPGTSTTVMAMYAYNVSFLRHNMGYGSAISIGLLVLSFVIILGVRLIMGIRKKGEEDNI
jgi:raffinose/stachyose/melibiose transport system permease protein